MPRIGKRHGPDTVEVAERIRAERERLELSQEDCARKLGMSRSTYRQLERLANPTMSTLVGLTSVLKMRLEAIAPELARPGRS